MKKLVTITGAPTTTKAVVTNLAFQLAKTAIVYVIFHTIAEAGMKSYLNNKYPS